MKIKNKLIAGGLMSVVACALVGSITGTFAWYQYSTKATASMHGISVGTTRNLETKLLSGTAAETDYVVGNLDWSRINAHLAIGEKDDDDNVKLAPVSNGTLGATSALNEKWYGNPNGTETLPEVTAGKEGYLQFKFNARIAESDGTISNNELQWEYPAGKLYVTDIIGVVTKNLSTYSADDELAKALRMHIQFGTAGEANAAQFVVNPTNSASETVTLSAQVDYVKQYDWQDPVTVHQTYQLPATGNAGTLVTSTHAAVKPTGTSADGKSLVGGIYGTIAEDDGVDVTVTVWLEGFAVLNNQTAPAGSDPATRNSNWWDFEANIGESIYVGFELNAIKG